MLVPRGQGMRQALNQVSSTTAAALKPIKSRLYRIPHEALPEGFLSSHDSINIGSCKYFSLRLKRLNKDVIDKINNGPSFLAGAYPPGLLHGRHEKYRLINHVKIDTWRTGEESERDHKLAETNLRDLAVQRIPKIGGDVDNEKDIPALIITSKKRVHKLSVVRHNVSKKIWRSFDTAVNELHGTPSQIVKCELLINPFIYDRYG